jgi:hypothetical protein
VLVIGTMIKFKHTICKPYSNEHHAHVGDLLWSLSYIKSHNCDAAIYLVCDDTLFDKVCDLLLYQPYIHIVDKYKPGQKIDVDLDLATRKTQDTSLLDVYYRITEDQPKHEPWLFCNERVQLTGGRNNLIYRNTNYRNRLFDWKYFVENENIDIADCCFVGAEHEYIQFILTIGVTRSKLPHHKTDTLMDLLITINSAEHFYTHAGLPLVLAHGLGVDMTVENGARLNNIPTSYKQDYMLLPINYHNVLSRDNCTYYEQYNRNMIEVI